MQNDFDHCMPVFRPVHEANQYKERGIGIMTHSLLFFGCYYAASTTHDVVVTQLALVFKEIIGGRTELWFFRIHDDPYIPKTSRFQASSIRGVAFRDPRSDEEHQPQGPTEHSKGPDKGE